MDRGAGDKGELGIKRSRRQRVSVEGTAGIKGVAVLRKAFRARNVFGTFEKLALAYVITVLHNLLDTTRLLKCMFVSLECV